MSSDVEVEVRLVAGTETAHAWGVTDGERHKAGPKKGELKLYWLPKSKCTLTEPDRDGNVTATMPEWLAIEKGLV